MIKNIISFKINLLSYCKSCATTHNNAFTLQGVLEGMRAHTVSPGGKRR